jgi:GntR family transcriptional regulator
MRNGKAIPFAQMKQRLRSSFSNTTPLHRQLFAVLQEQITSGALQRGSRLPSEGSLCERYGVSRITTRRALNDLAAIGLVKRQRGRGTFVRDDVPVRGATRDLEMFEGLRRSQLETQVTVVGVNRAVPPHEVATLLRIGTQQAGVHALRVRSVHAIPVILSSAWVNSEVGKSLTAAALRRSALYEILLKNGIVLGQTVQEISATVADKEQAELLQVEVGAPLLKLRRVMYDAQHHPVVHLTLYFSSDTSKVVMEFPSHLVNTPSGGEIINDVRFRLHTGHIGPRELPGPMPGPAGRRRASKSPR